MASQRRRITRRDFLKGSAALAAGLAARPLLNERIFASTLRQAVPAAVPISILINESPWLAGFEALVDLYKETTGNEVNLDRTPFPGMLDKSRNAVQASESEYDLLNLNEFWYTQFYDGGLVKPIKEIDPDFELDPNIIEYGASPRWDPEVRSSTPDGEIYGLPINGNIQLYYYRKDLFEENNIEVPQTWDEVNAVSEALQSPPGMYGFAVRAVPAWWEFMAYLESHGASIIDLNAETGEWTIGMETPEALEGVNVWHHLGTTYGPPNFGDLGQADLLALMASGRLPHVHMVGAAAPNFQDPTQSVVVDQVAATVVPGKTPESRATMSGIWVMGIPSNLVDERQQAALTFLNWALTKDAQIAYTLAGAIPVRQDVYEELSDDPDVGWWASAFAESTPYIKPSPRIPETSQIRDSVDLRMNQALIGELEIEEAVELAAAETRTIMEEAGYNVP